MVPLEPPKEGLYIETGHWPLCREGILLLHKYNEYLNKWNKSLRPDIDLYIVMDINVLFSNKLISGHSCVLTAQDVCIPWACCMFVGMCQCPGLHCVPCVPAVKEETVLNRLPYRQQGTRHSTLSQQSGSLTWEYLTPSVIPIDKWYSPPEGLVSGLARSQWQPTKDTYLWKLYSLDTTGGKSRNTASLYRRFTLNIRLIVVVLISKYCLDQ